MRKWWITASVVMIVALAVIWRCRSCDRRHAVAKVGSSGTAHAGWQLAQSPRASIDGVVRDHRATPISGARVCAEAERVPDPWCATTDATGHYTIQGLLATSYLVSASARAFRPAVYRPQSDRQLRRFWLAPGERRTKLDLVLEDGGVELAGVVLDVSGGPIEHAAVRAGTEDHDINQPGRWGPVAESDAHGAFSLWVSPGYLRITAVADGYAPTQLDATAPDHIEVLLTPEATISGTVVDATGTPVAHADVVANAVTVTERATTDENGTFFIHRLMADRYGLSARTASSYGRFPGSVLVGLGQHVEGVTIRMYAAFRIAGRVVVDGTTSACPDASVTLRDAIHDRDEQLAIEADGTAHGEGILPGTYVVHPSCPTYYAHDRYPPVVIVDRDATGLAWPVRAGARVTGRVLGRDGSPIGGAFVTAQGDHNYAHDTSRADGSFELVGLRPGELSLKAETDDAETVVRRTLLGTNDAVDLVLDRGGKLAGRVVDTDGQPIARLTVRASGRARAGGLTTTAASGSFELPVVPGRYRVLAGNEDFHPLVTSPEVSVAAGNVVDVKLVVPKQNGTIRGVVVDGAGKPVSDAYVVAYPGSDFGSWAWTWSWDSHPLLTGLDGTFAFKGIGGGSYTVQAYQRGGGGEARETGVQVGANVTLRMSAIGSIAGTVAFPDGAHPDDVDLTLRDESVGFYRLETFFRTSGAFAIRDLQPGTYRITAKAVDGLGVVEGVVLASGETKAGLAIRLERFVPVSGRVVEAGTNRPLAGFVVLARAARAKLGARVDPDNPESTSDDRGRFTVRSPTGSVQIEVSWPDLGATWCNASQAREVTGPVELGDVVVARRRVARGQESGMLGFELDEDLEVSLIAPRTPAAASTLRVGDKITSIDGIAVRGMTHSCAVDVLRVPPARSIALGLARGTTVTLIALPEP